MVNIYRPVKRLHSPYREVTLSFTYRLKNPNPPHIYNPTDSELERELRRKLSNALPEALMYGHKWVIHRDFIDCEMEDGGIISIDGMKWEARVRELRPNKKPLGVFRSIWYLLSGRYYR